MPQYRIKELLKERNITQKELAKKIGVSAVSLHRYLTGNTSVASLEKIAEALDVEISELFVHRREKDNGASIICPYCHNQINYTVKVDIYGEEKKEW